MFDSLYSEVISAINRWQPKRKYNNELQYRDDLMEFLREELNEWQPLFGFYPTKKLA